MKTAILCLLLIILGCSGCMAPNYTRLIPEDKDAHIEIASPIYGHIIIDTRAPGSPNPLPMRSR